MTQKRNAKIVGSGMFVPENIIPNAYFNDLLGEDVDSWLKTHVKIYERRWCTAEESTADLAEKSVLKALQDAKISREDVDLLIVATDTPEFISPSTASIIQERLQLINAGTFDVNTACAGFVTGLDIATKYIIADERYKNIVVVGVYAMSKYLNLKDKKTVTLFADGAAAVVVQSTMEDTGYINSKLITKGQYNEWMGIYAGGTKNPINTKTLEEGHHQLRFVQKIPPEINPVIWNNMVLDLCNQSNIEPSQIHHFFFTQININSIFATLDLLDIAHSKATTIMHHYGYTGSACIPMAFDKWRKKGDYKSGDIICFIGSGGGLAFGASLFRL